MMPVVGGRYRSGLDKVDFGSSAEDDGVDEPATVVSDCHLLMFRGFGRHS